MSEFDPSAIDEAGMAEDARAAAALRHQRTVRGDATGTTTFSPSGVTTDLPTPGQGDGPAETEAKPSREFDLDQFDAYRPGPLAGAARLADMSDLARMPETPNSLPDQPDARTLVEREWRKIFAEHATYDPRDPFGTALDAARSLTELDGFEQTSSGEAAPSSPQRRSIIDKLLGLTGERYQLWPERAVRDTLALPRDVMIAAQQYVPGRRGEDAELNDPLIERAADVAGLVMGGTFAGAPRGSLGAGPVRPPRPPQPRPASGHTAGPFRVEPKAAQEIESLIAARAPKNEIAAHPTIQAARNEEKTRPLTNKLPGYGTPEFEAARRFLFDGEEVIGYGAARVRLRQGAEAFSTEGPVEKGRVATIVLGLPAAGKSTISKPLARRMRAAILDSDEAKKVIPEYDGGIGARAVHSESNDLMWGRGGVAEQLLDERANLVIPRVGTVLKSIESVVDDLLARGYKVNLVHMTVDPDEAYRRMISRFLDDGRLIGSFFDRVGTKPNDTYNTLKAKGRIHQAVDIDANGPRGVLSVREGDADLAANILGRP